MLIPPAALSSAALTGLIREFILSHADGAEEQAVNDDAIAAVQAGLKRGELVISYAEHNDSAAIRLRSELPAVTDSDAG